MNNIQILTYSDMVRFPIQIMQKLWKHPKSGSQIGIQRICL